MRRYVFHLAILSLAALAPGLARGGDQEIAQQIIEKLQAEKQAGTLKKFSIDLQVDEGTVWLTGRVASEEQQYRALDLARRVPGVKQVVNDLTIAAPQSKPLAVAKSAPAPVSALPNAFAAAPQANAQSQTGGTPGEWLGSYRSARTLGLGGAYVAGADDPLGILWNPAGLSLMDQNEVRFEHGVMFEDASVSGIGFAVPLDGAEKVLEAMKAGKNIVPGYLGVQMNPAEGDEAGVVIAKLLPGGAAEKAGLKEGDRVLKVGDEEIRDGAQLRGIVGRHISGDVISITVRRGEEELQLEATLGERPQTPEE